MTVVLFVAWICGQAAREMETESDDEVMNVCVELLKRFLHVQEIPKPARLIR